MSVPFQTTLHHRLKDKALDASTRGGVEEHWRSTLKKTVDSNGSTYRLYMRVGGGKRLRITHLRALWIIAFGRPQGSLSNWCGDTDCINPFHYRDAYDIEQFEWSGQLYVAGGRLLDGIMSEEEFEASMNVRNPYGVSDEKLQEDMGLTHDFGCYQCGKRFDPLAGLNDTICPSCWTEDDQDHKENGNDA